MSSRSTMIVLVLVYCMATCSLALADRPIVPQDLGNLGYQASGVRQISEAGEIVGVSIPVFGASNFPFYWSQQTGMVNIGSCCAGGSANFITDDGMVIGDEHGPVHPSHIQAFYWTPSEGRVIIPLHYGQWQAISGVNSKSGMGIGRACAGDPVIDRCEDYKGFVWTKDGGTVDLGAGCVPLDINDSDQVVGFCGGAGFFWTAQQGKQDIIIDGQAICYAEAINNLGQVVGDCRTSFFGPNGPAFMWTESDGGITFDLPERSEAVRALAINDEGRVVGTAGVAFTWTQAGGVVPLEPPGLLLAGVDPHNPIGRMFGLSESGHIFLSVNVRDEFTGALTNHIYVWHEDTGYEDLGSGREKPEIQGWNDHGVAVGYQHVNSVTRTYIWSPNGGARLADCLVVGQQCIGERINNRGHVAGTANTGSSPPSIFALWITEPTSYGLPSVALGDLNGNGSPDLGVTMLPDTHVHVRDGSTDALISDIDFGTDVAIQMAALPDLNASGDPEIAMLNVQPDGQVRVQIRDSVTGDLVKYLWYGMQYEPVSMTVVPNYSGNGVPEIAVLGSEAGTDAVRVQIRDAGTNTFLDNVFLGTQSIATDLVAVADTSGNGIPEMGIMGVLKANDQVRMQIWDAQTAAFQSNVWFAKVYQPHSAITMPDINSNGSDEIVAMGVDPATQNIRVQVRDSDTTATLYNIWLGAVNEAVDIALINDINSDGVADLAVLLKTPGGTGRVRVQSGSDGAFIRNLFYSVVENPVGLAVMPDYSGNGFDELAVLGTSAGVRHVQILDTSSGAQVNRIDFP